MHILEIVHLKKYFKEVKAVDDISFSVEEGEFFAFLGVNGAGKSTAISVICGKEARTSGTVLVNGREVREWGRELGRLVGVVFQDSVLDRALTVEDNLRSRGALYGIGGTALTARIGELSALFGLGDILHRPFGKLSGGQRRRADIARALIHRPRLLILDEPTTGLDPQTRRAVWETVHALRKVRALTVFLTTHSLEEAAGADRVVILDGGKVKADGTPNALKTKYTRDHILFHSATEEELRVLGKPFERQGDAWRMEIEDPEEATRLILRHPALFKDYEIGKGSMDDMFLAVTGKRGTA